MSASGPILAQSKVSPRPMSGRATIARALWGLLALIHIWPLIAVLMKLAATPTLDRAASLLLLVALIAFSTAKAAGIRLLRSDRPRMELMVWLLAGGQRSSTPKCMVWMLPGGQRPPPAPMVWSLLPNPPPPHRLTKWSVG